MDVEKADPDEEGKEKYPDEENDDDEDDDEVYDPNDADENDVDENCGKSRYFMMSSSTRHEDACDGDK